MECYRIWGSQSHIHIVVEIAVALVEGTWAEWVTIITKVVGIRDEISVVIISSSPMSPILHSSTTKQSLQPF